MERESLDTSTRVPLMPPQATLKAFVLHFFVALISLLVFGYLAYLFCLWLKPFDYTLWYSNKWSFRSVSSQYSEVLNPLFRGLKWISESRIFIAGVLIIISIWIGWLRRRMPYLKIRMIKLPICIVLGCVFIVILISLGLMKLEGTSSLGFAVRQGLTCRIHILLGLGANPYKGIYTPFNATLDNRKYDIAMLFLNNRRPTEQEASRHLSDLALYTWSEFVNGDGTRLSVSELPEYKNLVKRILESGANPNCILSGRGSLPIQIAARVGNIRAIQILMECGAIVDASNLQGVTALHEAASLGHDKVVSFLIEHGSDPNSKDDRGNTPLDMAIKGYQEWSRLRSELDQKTHHTVDGRRLHSDYAGLPTSNYPEIIQLLKAHGAVTSSTTPAGVVSP